MSSATFPGQVPIPINEIDSNQKFRDFARVISNLKTDHPQLNTFSDDVIAYYIIKQANNGRNPNGIKAPDNYAHLERPLDLKIENIAAIGRVYQAIILEQRHQVGMHDGTASTETKEALYDLLEDVPAGTGLAPNYDNIMPNGRIAPLPLGSVDPEPAEKAPHDYRYLYPQNPEEVAPPPLPPRIYDREKALRELNPNTNPFEHMPEATSASNPFVDPGNVAEPDGVYEEFTPELAAHLRGNPKRKGPATNPFGEHDAEAAFEGTNPFGAFLEGGSDDKRTEDPLLTAARARGAAPQRRREDQSHNPFAEDLRSREESVPDTSSWNPFADALRDQNSRGGDKSSR